MKALFLTRLADEEIEEGLWVLLRPLKVAFEPSLTACDGTDIPLLVVPEGFETDYASVPRVPIAYMLAGGVGNAAAVVHDYLYGGIVPRMTADNAYAACLEACGVSWWQRQLMYAAVRTCGASRYKDQ